jgi:hypothetical protein
VRERSAELAAADRDDTCAVLLAAVERLDETFVLLTHQLLDTGLVSGRRPTEGNHHA